MNIAQGIDDILEKARNTHLYNILVKLQKMASFYRMVSGFFNAAICALHGDVEGYLLHLTNGLLGAIDFFGICELELLAQVIGKTLAAYDILIRMDKLSEASENGDILGIVEHSAMIFMDLWMLTSTCFDGDTLIATNEGQKRIDEIEAGDRVWAYNVETGELELKEVLTVYVKENDEILHLNTTEGDIDTTTNHPFYVISKGWVAAGDLEVADEILTIDGGIGHVLSFELETLVNPIPVYNIEVDDFHTYFVGDGDGWVLVHNTCRPESKLLRGGKHGVTWTEGLARAIDTGDPQGQWAAADLEYATEMANTLKPGEFAIFDLPPGSSSIVYTPEGDIVAAVKFWIRNNGTGTWHGYPMPGN